MSPEQAKGRQVDKRADIWAFGVVLYEILTGRQAFTGDDVSDVLVSIFRDDPDWSLLPEDTPARIHQTLRVCLQKDAKQRVRDVSAIRLAMAGVFETAGIDRHERTETPVAQATLWQRPVALALGALLIAVLSSLAGWSLTRAAPPTIVRMPILLGASEQFTSLSRRAVSISPDGRFVVYTANRGLSLRRVDQLEATPIASTFEGYWVSNPFFSADSQWIGYHAGGQLKKVSISGGAPITLCEAEIPYGASWGEDDTILFGQGQAGIWRVAATGGTPDVVIEVAEGERAQGPQMLPGGEAVLYTLGTGFGQWDAAQIVVEQLATGNRMTLIEGGRDARYLSTGHLVYLLKNVLFAVPFDPKARAVTGGPVSLIEGIRDAGGFTGAAHFSVADTGSLVYLPGGPGGGQSEFVWVDRTGQTQPVGVEPRAYAWGRVSPDGKRVAVDTTNEDDVWIYDLTREAMTRLTFDEASDSSPLWTPDGSRVVFRSGREGGGLFWKSADGTGEVERLLENPNAPRPYGWSTDGRLVFDQSRSGGSGISVVSVVSVDGDRTPELLLAGEFGEQNPSISPDGHWIAYDSRESGQAQIYVQPFPNIEDGKWQVSSVSDSDAAFDPVWSPDGTQLFFLSGPELMVVRVETEPTFTSTTPEVVFNLVDFTLVPGREYDIAPDGDRFLFQRGQGEQVAAGTASLVFVLNWHQELLERVPVP